MAHGTSRIKNAGFSLRRAWFQVSVGSRDDLVDHVVSEPTRREERVDLSLSLGRLERLPPPELARDRPPRAVGLAFCGHLAERGVDRLASDAFAAELAHQGAIALRPKA